MKAVIPAAGLGLRFLPATKAQPKEMLPVVDKPCIQYVVEEAVAAGIREIIIITGKEKWAIKSHFDRSVELERRLSANGNEQLADDIRRISELADISYVVQKEVLGLGHAVLCARKQIGDEPFAVLLGDDMIRNEKAAILQLMEIFKKTGGKSVVGVERVPRSNVSRYGVIEGVEVAKGLYELKDLVEKPAPGTEPSDIAILGRYIFTPAIFEQLAKIGKGIGGEIQLTDAMRLLAKQEKMYAFMISGHRFDLGNKSDWIKANVQIALERPELREEIGDWIKKEFSN